MAAPGLEEFPNDDTRPHGLSSLGGNRATLHPQKHLGHLGIYRARNSLPHATAVRARHRAQLK